jgi:hypothetical protein
MIAKEIARDVLNPVPVPATPVMAAVPVTRIMKKIAAEVILVTTVKEIARVALSPVPVPVPPVMAAVPVIQVTKRIMAGATPGTITVAMAI